MSDHFDRYFKLDKRVALVTGGSKGLGYAAARVLAEAGARVALCSRHEAEAAAAAARIAAETGSRTLGLRADVGVAADIERLMAAVSAEFGQPDILVANAGINVRKPVTDLTQAEWDAVMDVNLRSAFLAAQHVVPAMRARKWGRIVFLSSMLGFISLPGRAAYSASKSGILGLMRALALETARDGICVNAICPGPFRTPMNRPVFEDAAKNSEFLDKLPVGRWGDPDEFAGLVLYLCAPACSFMTGSSIVIDGGWSAQ